MASVLGDFAGLGGGSIGRASVDLVLNAQAYDAGLADAEGKTAAATAKMGTGFSGFQQQVKSSFSGAQIAMVGFGAVAAGALVKAIGATTQWADQVRTLQRTTGQSAESASTFTAAAEKLGVSVDKMQVGFGILEKNIVNGSANLEKYGVATRDATGAVLPFDTVLQNVADKFNSLPKGAEQAAFVMNAFGRSGRALIPILQEGSAGFDELRAEAEKAGLVMSQQTLDASLKLEIAQRQLGDAVKGAAVQIGVQLLPVVTQATQDLTAAVETFNKIPAPIKASVLAFIALNGALVAVRGIWSVTAGVITKNATALGLHTAATEADTAATTESAVQTQFLMGRRVADTAALEAETAATEQAGIATRALNSELVATVGPLLALAKGAQDGFSELSNVLSGNVTGALHNVTTELNFYSNGLVKVVPDLGAFQSGLQDINNALQAGTITTQDATTQADALAKKYGVDLPQSERAYIQAQQGATAAAKAGGATAMSLAQHEGDVAAQAKLATEASIKHAAAMRAEKIAEAQLSGGLVGLIGDQEALNAAQAKVNQLRDNGKTGTLAYHDAVASLIGAQQTLNQDLHTQAQNMRQAGVPLSDIKDKLEGVGKQAGLTKAEVDKFITGLKGAQGLLDTLTSRTHVINVEVHTTQVGQGLPPAIQAEVNRLLARGI